MQAPLIRPLEIEKDAEALVEMWRASDNEWPGTFSGGVPITAEWIRVWHERELAIKILVAEIAEAIVGYCSLVKKPDEEDVGYVHVINVQPEYQGRSIARRMLNSVAQLCADLGFVRVDLHTWPGNLKSVPLYKKTGYFWMPQTNVWMLNFMPGILQLPPAQRFFEQHDWYKSFKRELLQEEDKQEWHGMHVFTYHWEAEGEYLTIWVDREARTIAGIETNDMLAAAIADPIEPSQGLPVNLRWRLENRGDHPLDISLIASGSEPLQLDHRATLLVPPGRTVEETASVRIPVDAKPPTKNKPAPAIRSLMVVNGEVLELGTGFRYRPAVEIEAIPRFLSLNPGHPHRVHLRLRNHLRKAVRATVQLTPVPGLDTDWRQKESDLPAQGFAGLSLCLEGEQEGVSPLAASIAFRAGDHEVKTSPKDLPVFVRAPGSVLAHQEEDQVWAENDHIRFRIRSEGGRAVAMARSTGRRLLRLLAVLGPPFEPSEFDYKPFDLEVDRAEGKIIVSSSARSEVYAGLTLKRCLTFTGGPLVRIDYYLVNDGIQPHTVKIQQQIRFFDRDEGTMIIPLRAGMVRAPAADYPVTQGDAPGRPEAYSERWVCLQRRRTTLGYLWGDELVEHTWGWRLENIFEPDTCQPGEWTEVFGGYLFLGQGGWKTVRAAARRLAGLEGTPEPIPAQPRPLQSVRLEPVPLVTLADEAEATLVVDNLRGRQLSGQVRLWPPADIEVDPSEFTIEAINLEKSFSAPLRLNAPKGPRACQIQAELDMPPVHRALHLPLLRLGEKGEVELHKETLEGQQVFTIDNTRFRFQVSPDFSATLSGWWEGEVNHLLSAFPEIGTFGWLSPWFGGIQPLLMSVDSDPEFPGMLHQERFNAEPLSAPDERGIPWQGLRLYSNLEREEFRGMELEVAYLTLHQSNVLKLSYRLSNRTTAQWKLTAGWLSFWRVDGEHRQSTLTAEEIERRRSSWQAWPLAGNWSAVTNPATGRTAMMISPYPRVHLTDWGVDGGHLAWLDVLRVPSKGAVEREIYLALTDSLEEAKVYRHLDQYGH